jgi:hypothetical protein
MNLEPQHEAPRRREQIKKAEPTAAQYQAQAETTMRELRETFARDKAELAEQGIAEPEIDSSGQEAEKAYQALQDAIREAEQENQAEAEPFDENEYYGRVMDAVSASPVNFSDLEALRAEMIAHSEKARITKEALENRIGPRYTEKLLNPEYARALEQLQTFLENGIDGMEDLKLFDAYDLTTENLIAVHETLGSPEDITRLVKALDLKQELTELNYGNQQPVIQPAMANFEMGSGELDASITLANWYDDGSHIVRGFTHKPMEQEDGTVSAVRSVKHDVFNINPEHHNKGLAKRVLADSVQWYLDQNEQRPEKPIADIRLEANIDVGGYAWASYGFGWDKEQMTAEDIRDYVGSCKGRAETIASHVRELGLTEDEERGVSEMLAAYEQALANPDITPQELALIGKDGPLFRQDASHNWYTERQFALEERETSEEFPGNMHAGKYGMLGKDHRWHGTVELTGKGKQGGKNLSLLQKRIS